jgi:hypothetical protein
MCLRSMLVEPPKSRFLTVVKEMDHLAERACDSSGLLAFRGGAREVALEDGGVVDLLPRFVRQQRGLVRCGEPLGVSALDDRRRMTLSSSSANAAVRLLTLEYPPPAYAKLGPPRRERRDGATSNGHGSGVVGENPRLVGSALAVVLEQHQDGWRVTWGGSPEQG